MDVHGRIPNHEAVFRGDADPFSAPQHRVRPGFGMTGCLPGGDTDEVIFQQVVGQEMVGALLSASGDDRKRVAFPEEIQALKRTGNQRVDLLGLAQGEILVSFQRADHGAVQVEPIEQSVDGVQGGIQGHDNPAGSFICIPAGSKLGEAGQQPGNPGSVMVIGIQQGSIHVEAKRLDSGDIEGHKLHSGFESCVRILPEAKMPGQVGKGKNIGWNIAKEVDGWYNDR